MIEDLNKIAKVVKPVIQKAVKQVSKTNMKIDFDRLDSIILDVKSEFLRASKNHKKFNSAHEGYMVIYEEFHKELFDEIHKLKSFDDDSYGIYKEAIQVCAMTLRFIYDCCNVWNP